MILKGHSAGERQPSSVAVCCAALILLLLAASPAGAGQSWTWDPAPNLNQARSGHTATLLADGKVLIAGGKDAAGQALATAEIFDLSTGVYTQLESSLPAGLWGHTATRLNDGKVLIAGGNDNVGQPISTAVLFDPSTGAFAAAASLGTPRSQHTATLLPDGRVLIAGGADGTGALPGLEAYDPGTGGFSLEPRTLQVPRQGHSATSLANGRVLIVGGSNSSGILGSAEIYDPANRSVSAAGSLNVGRSLASAALLLDGKVLVAGGQDLNSAEVYDPNANKFTLLGTAMTTPRSGHTGITLLHNGKVLLAGGTNAGAAVPTAEVYDPVTGTFWEVGQPGTARRQFGANFLALPYAGRLLATGGLDAANNPLASSETFFYPTLRSDKPDYAPGDTVTLMGEGWAPGETVAINLHESNSDPDVNLSVTADASGAFTVNAMTVDQSDINQRFLATGTGQSSRWTAQTTFTDSVTSVTITSPTSASPQAITSLPATVTVSFNYVTSSTGTTTGQADILAAPTLSNTKTLTPGTGSDSIIVTIPAGTANGTYNVKVTVTNSTGTGANNKNDNQNGAVIVNVPACTAPSVTAQPASATKVVGDSVTFSVTATGTAPLSYQWRKNSSNIAGATGSSYTIASVTTSGAGSYDVVVSNSCGTATSNAATLIVNKATPTITWNNPADITYGTALSGTQLNATTSVPGTFVYTPAAGTVLNAGNGQTLHVDFTPTDTANYNNASKDVTINVLKATLTVTADKKTREYGDANPPFTASFSGFKNAETLATSGVTGSPSLTTTATATSPVSGSPYTIIAALGTLAAGNYTFAFVDGQFTVTKATLTVTADNKTKVYGAALPPLTATFTGFKNGETLATSGVTGSPDLTTTATASSTVPGPYPITAALGTLAAGNYTFSFVNGSLTVTPAPLTVKADDKTKVLMAPLPPFTASYSGFVLGEGSGVLGGTLTFTTPATASIPVGTYPITPGGLTSTNYAITFANGTLYVQYAAAGTPCLGSPGHTILQPINADGSSVFKQKSTVPAKFRVCDAYGNSIGTPGVVSSFRLIQIISGTTSDVDETVDSTTPDTAFRWDPTDQQWIFNMSTKSLSANTTYVYLITLNDGTTIQFRYGLK